MPETSSVTAQLNDMQGRIVSSSQLEGGIHTLSIHSLAPGIYILQLKDEKGRRREFQMVK